jgi:hypothetical protein
MARDQPLHWTEGTMTTTHGRLGLTADSTLVVTVARLSSIRPRENCGRRSSSWPRTPLR